MNCDRISITDPPEFASRYEPDDTPEQLGDSFEISVEERAKITQAAQWGRSLILAARAGDPQALADLQTRMHVMRYETVRP